VRRLHEDSSVVVGFDSYRNQVHLLIGFKSYGSIVNV
jgi:hypothetical protein